MSEPKLDPPLTLFGFPVRYTDDVPPFKMPELKLTDWLYYVQPIALAFYTDTVMACRSFDRLQIERDLTWAVETWSDTFNRSQAFRSFCISLWKAHCDQTVSRICSELAGHGVPVHQSDFIFAGAGQLEFQSFSFDTTHPLKWWVDGKGWFSWYHGEALEYPVRQPITDQSVQSFTVSTADVR